METRKILVVVLAVVFMVSGFALAERDYRHVITVGKDPCSYDYTKINEAIRAMNEKQPPLDEYVLGCIEVNDGNYVEHLNDYYEDGNDLPAHCDLIGMGEEIDNVVIQHSATQWEGGRVPIDLTVPAIRGNGDNIISHLKVYNYFDYPDFYWQAGVSLGVDSRMEDCIVESWHGAVHGGENMVISGCTMTTMFGACINAKGTFEVSDCVLKPKAYTTNIEGPTGVRAYGSGTIENVNIESNTKSNTKYAGAGLFGIYLSLEEHEEVLISDVEIDLQLESHYLSNYPDRTAPMRVCGILSGSHWRQPNYDYPGHAIVRDCTISVTGIEDSGSDPCDTNDDGAGLMVNGICVRGGGTVEVWGYTDITTSRTTAGHAEDGYEYSLNNENGTLAVDVDDNLVSYDPNKTNGTISDLVRAINITHDIDYFTVQAAIDDANAFDVIEAQKGKHYEYIDFDDKPITVRSTDPGDWDVVEATIIDASGSDHTAAFYSGEDENSILRGFMITGGGSDGVYCHSSDPVVSQCIIENNGSYGVYCSDGGSPTVTNNIIRENGSSGVLYTGSTSKPTIKNNWIYDNNYGIFSSFGGAAEITNNTIAGNTTSGIRKVGPTSPTITNCIIWDNGDDLYNCSATYSCIEDPCDAGGAGNISSDPCFVDEANDDYHINLDSPCINAGDPCYTSETGETDIDGNPRVMDFCGRENDAVVDMGADEAFARAHNVTHDLYYLCIQDGIDDANNGDVVEVYERSLPEAINFKRKAITLRSTDPCDPCTVAATIIDADGLGNTVTFNSGEDANSLLKGLTITGGIPNGVYCEFTSPVIRNCVIKGNEEGVRTFGIGYSPLITNSKIHNNINCGVWALRGTARIRNNWIFENASGIKLTNINSSEIYNNTITDNTNYGIEKGFGAPTPTISNCILWGNVTQLDSSFNDDITYSCIEDWTGSGDGNITTDPNFVDAANDDYGLTHGSGCIDSANGNVAPATDIFGQARIDDPNTPNTGIGDPNYVDMGACEYNPD